MLTQQVAQLQSITRSLAVIALRQNGVKVPSAALESLSGLKKREVLQ